MVWALAHEGLRLIWALGQYLPMESIWAHGRRMGPYELFDFETISDYLILSYLILKPYQREGLAGRINEPPWGRCLQGAVDARWVVLLLLLSSPHTGVILD